MIPYQKCMAIEKGKAKINFTVEDISVSDPT